MLLATNALGSGFHYFEYATTLLSGEGGEGRTGTATMFRKMLPKYALFSTVLSEIVAFIPEVLLAIYSRQVIHRTSTDSTP